MAQTVLTAGLGIQQVLFVPTGHPPHRSSEGLLPALDRYKLVSLAIADNPGFQVSDFEVRKQSLCYTVETLQALEPLEPNKSLLPLVMGTDTVNTLPTWHQSEHLLARTQILEITRPDCPRTFTPPNHQTLEMPPLAISASWIRQQFKSGIPESARYMLPKKALQYLLTNNLKNHWL